MPLPETIPVRYTEEEAEYLSLRPVRRQTFRIHELVDMILSVTGKDAARIEQILRSGTVVYNFYRYWWEGFQPDAADLQALLARFPDAEPGRAFRAKQCRAVVFESSGTSARSLAELEREQAATRRWFRSRSLWDSVLALAAQHAPAYVEYSYARRADLYRLELAAAQAAALAAEAERLAPRALRSALRGIAAATCIIFVCPR